MGIIMGKSSDAVLHEYSDDSGSIETCPKSSKLLERILCESVWPRRHGDPVVRAFDIPRRFDFRSRRNS